MPRLVPTTRLPGSGGVPSTEVWGLVAGFPQPVDRPDGRTAPIQGKTYSSAQRTGEPESQSIFYREGAASIVEVLENPDGNRDLIINGSINASAYPVSVGLRAHRLIAQLPLLLGLGSGMTSGAALQLETLESIECAE